MITRYFLRIENEPEEMLYRIDCESEIGNAVVVAGVTIRKNEWWFNTQADAVDAINAMLIKMHAKHDAETAKILDLETRLNNLPWTANAESVDSVKGK